MNQNYSILKILFLALSVIILGIAIGSTSSDTPLISLALCIAPISVLSVFFIKEKIWYTWFLLPSIFLLLGEKGEYNYIILTLVTFPFYIWYVIRKKSSITWNKLPLLDIPIILLFIYISYVFINNPFGIGLDFFEEYYGGKGYVLCLGALLVFFLFSSLNTTSLQLSKLLNWSIPILIFSTLASSILELTQNSDGTNIHNATTTQGEANRESAYIALSILILQLIIIKYDIKKIIIKIWPSLTALLACYGLLISGFRSRIAIICLYFICVCILYKRWATIVIIPIAGIIGLGFLSSNGHLRDLPYGVQRCFAPLEFLDIDPTIRQAASGSIDWRTQMWEWALDDRELFIKDKIWGDGFSQQTSLMKAGLYVLTYNLKDTSDKLGNLGYAYQGMWHSGPISAIHTIGYVGLSLFSILSIIGMFYSWIVCKIYKQSRYKVAIIYTALLPFINVPIFYFIYADAFRAIPLHIIHLSIVKLLYCLAVKEKIYIPKSARKEYIPMVCRQANSEPA